MKLKAFTFAALVLIFISLSAVGSAATPPKVTTRAQDILDGMTLHEKVCQMMVSYQYTLPNDSGGMISATETGTSLANALSKYPVGGILYDAASMSGRTHDQVKDLLTKANSYSNIPLLFTIDEEGGRVARIANTLGYHVGSPTKLNDMLTYESQGSSIAKSNAKHIAINIAWHGFNLDFAPVADTYTNSSNTVIGTRAYSTDYATAAELVVAAIEGFHEGGVGCTLKHFPGHGDTSGDTHAGSVVLKKTVDQLRTQDLIPFQAGIDAGADAVMLAHIIVEEIGEPTLFSKYLVTDVLRNEMGFDGLIITDGLAMKAMTAVYSTSDIVLKGTKAGVDVFLCPMSLPEAVSALEEAIERGEITESRIDESVLRILQYKIKWGIIK